MSNLILVMIEGELSKVLNKTRIHKWEIIDSKGNVEGVLNVDSVQELSTFIEYCMKENEFEVHLESEIFIND